MFVAGATVLLLPQCCAPPRALSPAARAHPGYRAARDAGSLNRDGPVHPGPSRSQFRISKPPALLIYLFIQIPSCDYSNRRYLSTLIMNWVTRSFVRCFLILSRGYVTRARAIYSILTILYPKNRSVLNMGVVSGEPSFRSLPVLLTSICLGKIAVKDNTLYFVQLFCAAW